MWLLVNHTKNSVLTLISFNSGQLQNSGKLQNNSVVGPVLITMNRAIIK